MVDCRVPSMDKDEKEDKEDKEDKEHNKGRMCKLEHCTCLQLWEHRADMENNRERMDVEHLVRGKEEGVHWQAYQTALQIVLLQTGRVRFAQKVLVVGELFVLQGVVVEL